MSHDGGREKSGMLPVEKRAAGSLAAIFGLRMLGLFMLLPILALYAEDLEGSTPLLMGLALGYMGLLKRCCRFRLECSPTVMGAKS